MPVKKIRYERVETIPCYPDSFLQGTLLATKAQRIGDQAPARWELRLSTPATKAQQTALRVEEKKQ